MFDFGMDATKLLGRTSGTHMYVQKIFSFTRLGGGSLPAELLYLFNKSLTGGSPLLTRGGSATTDERAPSQTPRSPTTTTDSSTTSLTAGASPLPKGSPSTTGNSLMMSSSTWPPPRWVWRCKLVRLCFSAGGKTLFQNFELFFYINITLVWITKNSPAVLKYLISVFCMSFLIFINGETVPSVQLPPVSILDPSRGLLNWRKSPEATTNETHNMGYFLVK